MIRHAMAGDEDGIWATLEPMLRAGDSFTLPVDWTRDEALAYWLDSEMTVFVAEEDGGILGTYYLRPNQKGGGDHVANAGYVVHPDARGRGLARLMGEHSLQTAKALGFSGMQFNAVVDTNTVALNLWLAIGFQKVGVIPRGFRHPQEGFVDAHILYRDL